MNPSGRLSKIATHRLCPKQPFMQTTTVPPTTTARATRSAGLLGLSLSRAYFASRFESQDKLSALPELPHPLSRAI